MPSIKAGKDVFVEWPLAANLQQAEEMLAAAKQSGSKTIVGLQGRASPYTLKIKELVTSKAVGDLLSSNITLETSLPGDSEPPGTDLFVTKETGANLFTIFFGHCADAAYYALGGLDDVSALLTTRWPEVKVLNGDGSFKKLVKRETPDHIMMHGTLTNNSAPISVFVRTGKPFKDTSALTWRILGTKGEIRLTAFANLSLGVGGEKIEVFDHEKDTVEVVEVEYTDEVKELPAFAKNIGRVYELFATGGTAEQGFVSFEEAVVMQKIIDRMWKSSDAGKKEKI